MREHQPTCARSQFWDAGEQDAPCTCKDDPDLIARLKAAHEAFPPAPWRVRFEVSTYDGDDMEGHRDSFWVEDARDREVSSDDEDFLARIALIRNNLPEIIAVLEAARSYRDRLESQAAGVEPWNAPEIDGGICAALDALEEKS